MADIKTVALTGGEVKVSFERRHCHIRNLGKEMIYASVKPGIVPDADGVLGIPAGTKDVLTNTDGFVYLKGNGKVQLVGSEYADGILGGLAGGDITAAVAAAVAKIVADAPEDFDTLKEISDWIYSHADSAAEMNSEIQSLKTNKADKSDIPTELPANGGNADMLDKKHADDFLQKSGAIIPDRINMAANPLVFGSPVGFAFFLQNNDNTLGIYNHDSKKLAYADYNGFHGGDADTLDGLHANELILSITNLTLQALCPTNKFIYDDRGKLSVMVYIPKFRMSDVIDGASGNIHPAFIVNGVEKDGFWVSKYENVVRDDRAYSLPGEDPAADINADTSRSYCESKGKGWHLMTAAEWGALALWCKKNGWLPWGNNNYGKDTRETMHKAIPTFKDVDGTIYRVATGTGPIEWSHNKQLDGIYDLNGNVWEWVDGTRLVYGELQVLEDNNAADSGNSKTEASAAWKAINGVTGELIVPDGNGTTANSIKLDFINNAWKWITDAISSKIDISRNAAWANTTADTSICDAAKELLYALALLPDSTTFDYESDIFYANNGAAERFLSRGGYYVDGTSGGVFSLAVHSPRSIFGGDLGFRSAFIE